MKIVLQGNSAAVMTVAKRGLIGAGETNLQRLQVAIGAMAGLRKASDVRIGDVLRIVATLHDELTDQQLLMRPAASMVDSLVRSYVMGPPKEDAPTLLLNCMLSNICLMRIRTEAGEAVVDWESGLPENFHEEVARLCGDREEAETPVLAG